MFCYQREELIGEPMEILISAGAERVVGSVPAEAFSPYPPADRNRAQSCWTAAASLASCFISCSSFWQA